MERGQKKSIYSTLGLISCLCIYFGIRWRFFADYQWDRTGFLLSCIYLMMMVGVDVRIFLSRNTSHIGEMGLYWAINFVLYLIAYGLGSDFMFGFGIMGGLLYQDLPLYGFRFVVESPYTFTLLVGAFVSIQLLFFIYLNRQMKAKVQGILAGVVVLCTALTWVLYSMGMVGYQY